MKNSTELIPQKAAHRMVNRIRTRVRVTTALYLITRNRARSLSTLIVVNLVEETPQNIPPAILIGIPIRWQMLGGFWYHQISNVRLLQNETHAEICARETAEQQFRGGGGGGELNTFVKLRE